MKRKILLLGMKLSHKIWDKKKKRSVAYELKIMRNGPELYASRKMLYPPEVSNWIVSQIDSKKPFMLGRLGAVEVMVMRTFDFCEKKKYTKVLAQAHECAGFYPEEEKETDYFRQRYKDAIANCDGLGIWRIEGEKYYIKKYAKKNMSCFPIEYFSSWLTDNPWTRALHGKKVLLVHPFCETMRKQYESKRNDLFSDEKVLPLFSLICYQPVQSAAGAEDVRFKSWSQALTFMEKEIDEIDFDIALIACGAYGFPLAAHIKDTGRQAIHMGGVLQMLFGVKGSRWLDDPMYNKYFNDAWVYPSKKETPIKAGNVENGAYWGNDGL